MPSRRSEIPSPEKCLLVLPLHREGGIPGSSAFSQARRGTFSSVMRMRLLLVDDDPSSLETGELLLRRAGYDVESACTGRDAVRLLLARDFDLALIDYCLPDISGLDVIQTVKNEGLAVNWILFSGFMDYEVARQAGNLGAIRTLALPIDLETVVAEAAKTPPKSHGWWKQSLPRHIVPRNAADRWAHLVIRACDAEQDLRTISHWASSVGCSESTVIAACRVLNTSPRRARDFLRILRALRLSSGSPAQLEAALSVADPRTYRILLENSGLAGRHHHSVVSLEEYLRLQQFLPSDHCGLSALKAILQST